MWNFANLARPTGQFGRPGHPYPYPPPHFNRANGEMTASKKAAMVDAGVYKGTAVLTSGIVGAISAYKGLPEVKGTMGLLSFDVIVGLLLSGAEFAMLWKGKSGKSVAAVGGVSTGLLCHWAAVQGTIWGAGKAKAETTVPPAATKGFDYDAHEGGTRTAALPDARRNAPVATAPARARTFDPYYGMM
jgi:hypothetical protein